MAQKSFKYSHLYSLESGHTPTVGGMLVGEIAINLNPNDTHIWSSNGTEVIDLCAKIGGDGNENTIHSELVNGKKEFSSLAYIKKITDSAVLPENVKERYQLVGSDGNPYTTASGNTSENIDIYKDSSIAEIYVGTNYDSVDETTGVVTKKQIGDVVEEHTIDEKDFKYLIYVYVNANGKYSMTKIDMARFLAQPQYQSGTTIEEGIVHGVVDSASDSLVTEWSDGDATSAGTSANTATSLSVGENGFKAENIQNAINAKHANTILMNGYTSGVTEDLFGIEATDTIMQAIKKVEDKLCSNGNGIGDDGTSIEVNNTGIIFKEGSAPICLLSAGTF